MSQTFVFLVQTLILASGIYVFLRFLRTTRGVGVLRGLVVALAIGVVVLWGLAKYLELEELKHIIQSITPYLAVILTILFQPELRRAIARLGEHNRLARFLGTRRSETVHEVAQAAIELAARREGALIAFQRETPLDAYTQNAVSVDAEVKKLLIESIFHPGSTLHDGAIVIQNDRVAAAACIFPLTENPDLSKSMGTRHRAGLGLSEESDAVTLIVSEETGAISVCHQGHMDRHIPTERLESVLLERLGYDLEDPLSPRERQHRDLRKWLGAGAHFVYGLFTQDLLRKFAAILLGGVLIFLAHQEITVTETLALHVLVTRPGSDQATPKLAIEVRLPGEDYNLVSPQPGQRLEVEVKGTRAELDNVRTSLRGLVTVGTDLPPEGVEFSLRQVAWSTGMPSELDVSVRWKSDPPPRLQLERYDLTRIELEPRHVPVDASALDPRLSVLTDQIELQPDSIEVRGPAARIEELRDGRLPFVLEPIVLGHEDRTRRTIRLRLSQELAALGLEIVQGASATLKIIPAERALERIEKEIVVVPDPSREFPAGAPGRFSVSQFEHVARFRIRSAGIIPVAADPGSRAFQELSRTVRDYVLENLDVVVRVSDLVDDAGFTVPVRYFWPPTNWRHELSKRTGNTIDQFAELDVILESEPRVRLVQSD